MKCERCPYLQSLEAKRAESDERIARAQELAGMGVVAEAQNALTAEIIAGLPEGPQKEEAQAALDLALSMSSLHNETVDTQPNTEAFFLDQLDNLVHFAVSQCSGGPSTKRRLFGGEKLVCISESTVVDNEFRR